MEFSNEGQSFYHRFQGSLPGMIQLHRRTSIESNITQIYQSLEGSQQNFNAVMANTRLPQATATTFEQFFLRLILSQADPCTHNPSLHTPEIESTTQQIVDLFDSYLRYQGKDDKWAEGGRTYFAHRVRHFTNQNAQIELCLPAFPCKSSNTDKVTGPDPDRGEELALERLHGFVEAIKEVYQPGAKLWIISDGHVFSDCIGVNDADVDAYGEKLKEMNYAVGLRRGNTERLGFKSLVDLFQLSAVDSSESPRDLARRLNIPTIDHHVNTDLTDEAELCRRILVAGCGPQKAAVRAKIDSKDPAITALYRGFSRFMLEDLEHHPHTRNMTKSQQKKLSSKVAFEMILRNQAYSNLVELLFPNHVRLSIHAHNNAGPKFGIQLFDPSSVRAVQGLSPDGELMTSLDLLHIPTPWHNSVVQLAGSDVVLVTKAKLARAAVAAGSMTGGLVRAEEGKAHFVLCKKGETVEASANPAPVETEGLSKEKEGEEQNGVRTEGQEVAVSAPATAPENRRPLRRARTFSQKMDAVTAVVRRNTGTFSAATEPSWPTKAPRRDSWLGMLRWLLSLLWPRA